MLPNHPASPVFDDLSKPQPCTASFLQKFAAHKYAPALLNYAQGACVFTGAALFFTGVAALPGVILMVIGMASMITNTGLLAGHLPEEMSKGDYLVFSGECFVWGACFVFTLPTIILLMTTLHCVTNWLNPLGVGDTSAFDFTFLTRAPRIDKEGDLPFSGLEC